MRFYRGYRWEKLLYERFTEPLHLNLISGFVKMFGSFRAKVAFDLTERRSYAHSILRAADMAKDRGLKQITVVECGVASGLGLMAMCRFAEQGRADTGVEVKVVGFDTGEGLPPPADYRDHPDLFRVGDYPMNQDKLIASLPPHCSLILGPIAETVPKFVRQLNRSAPLGFVSIDVDYYSSSMDALTLFSDPDPEKYLPISVIFFDDIADPSHNAWCGELLAIDQFNEKHEMRKIQLDRFLKHRRLLKNAEWLDHIYLLHVLDHPVMQRGVERPVIQLANRYLGIRRNEKGT
jgi:hypothetical protein